MSDSATPQTVAGHAPLFMELSRQDYWSEFPFPTPPTPLQEAFNSWLGDYNFTCHMVQPKKKKSNLKDHDNIELIIKLTKVRIL